MAEGASIAGNAHTGPAKPRRAPSLRGRLLSLVLACVLPVVVFGLGDAYLGYQADRAEAGRRTLDLARSLALTVERDIQGRLGALQALALSRSARGGDVEGFRPAAEAMLARQMPGANILLLREDGQQVMNTAVPPGEPLLARRDTTTLRQLFATGQPSVSDVFVGVTLRRPIVALEVPVFGQDGKVVYGLTLNPTTEAFNKILRRQRLPERWVLGLYDRRGAFIARSRDGERVDGQAAGSLLLPRLLSEREGLVETVSRDGVPVLTAFSRIESSGWTAAVSVPLAEIAAPAWRSAVRTLVSGLVFLAAGLGLALAVAQRITGPIASLGDLASAPDRERGPPAAAETGLAEVDKVAEALVSGARERRAAEAALRESGLRLRLALDASQLGTWLWEVGGGNGELVWDARCKALFGLPPDARVDYAAWAGAIPPEDRPAAEAGVARALDPADPHDEYDCEYRARHPGGRVLWLRAIGRAIFEPDPAAPAGRRAVRIIGTIGDVTERRAAEERQALLMREVDHRAKNALAVALSLVRLAPRDDAARFAAGVEGRIAAMARAHSLLAQERWSGADLRALAAGELAAYADRVDMEGPPARLSADAAQPVAMLLHELATNAAKHGALSAPAGRVALAWDFTHGPRDAPGTGLRLRWTEHGGPPIAGPPRRGGFGSRLLVSLAERQLGGRLALRWEPDGLCATIALPPRHAWPLAPADAAGRSAARTAAAPAMADAGGDRPALLRR